MTHSRTAIRHACSAAQALMALTMAMVPAPSAFADADVTFHGTLLEAPPCEINGNELIVVDFGNEVMTTRVDGTNYRQAVRFTVDCSAATSLLQKVRISGTPATFDNSLLAGSQTGFGFAFYNNVTPMPLGSAVTFTAPTVPPLYVIPVKQSGVTLTGGAFSTLASLIVEYQ
ncbi:exotoxin [Enterobacter cancerogenus]|uniref:fimbrial protein n=1 Tax=Enterobacter cancerogenus TaxID=69218 RepID=UPI000C9B2F62|nr:fimbrial protein [Enterobacter cancerogenus]PNF13480.1 exotoxin [Enterobacter cancerogenus]